MNVLTTATLVGFAFFFIVEFVRALPWPEKLKRRKPLSCSTCMVGWCVVVHEFYAWFRGEFSVDMFIGIVAAAGIARALLALRTFFEPELPST